MQNIALISLVISLAALLPTPALAHVVVKPGEVKSGAFHTFTISVPNEKDTPTIAIKLEIPASLKHVTPTVKPGWQVALEKEDETATVKAISWTGGSIPADLRDDFTFSAQVPAQASTLQWKAYQTYETGVVSWNLQENEQPKNAEGKPDFSSAGPFSTTKVVAGPEETVNPAQPTADRALYLAIASVIISLVAVFLATRKSVK